MKLHLDLDIAALQPALQHRSQVLLTGSCFTEHIGSHMQRLKMNTFLNPHGIIFNPSSIAHSLRTCMRAIPYTANTLFLQNELWHHWDFHSRYSHTQRETALQSMNTSLLQAHDFLKTADWLFITLGSAYQYHYKPDAYPVANCHKVPAHQFDKKLLQADHLLTDWQQLMQELLQFNPKLQVLFTVSPVRHYRDGLIENNLSKAQLLLLCHALCNTWEQAHYFPAYELVIDVLRDHRFYDADLVHPNIQAVDYVWERFVAAAFDVDQQTLLQKIQKIVTATQHRVQHTATDANRKFQLQLQLQIQELQQAYPYLRF
jgi:hypothetical protein